MKNLIRLISLFIIYIILAASPLCASDIKESLLSDGRWMKVAVDTTGVHLLPIEMLMAMGFSDIDRITVAGYGSVERAHSLASAPDDLPVLPVRRTARGLLFMAEGDVRIVPGDDNSLIVHRNHYSRGSYYYIGVRDGMRSPEIATAPASAAVATTEAKAEAATTYLAVEHHDFIDERPFDHGLFSFTRNFAGNPDGYDVTFHPSRQLSDTEARLYYTVAWLSTVSGGECKLSVSDGTDIGEEDATVILNRNNTVANQIYSALHGEARLSGMPEGKSVTVNFRNSNSEITTFLALRTATLVYERKLSGTGALEMLHIPSLNRGGAVEIGALPDGAEVWDVTRPRSPQAMKVVRPEGSAQANVWPGVGCHTLVAFDPESLTLPEPRVVGEVSTQSLHSMDDVDMLIVTNAVTHQAALRLADAHRHMQGLKVAVVNQEEIFNEFSSGALHPAALRAMARMLRRRDLPLRFILLMGQGSSDTRRDHDHSQFEPLVTYCSEDFSENGNENKCYTPDLYFGITDDHDIPSSLAVLGADADVSVGRLAVTTSEQAESYVDKAIDYLSDPRRAGTFNHGLISACYGERHRHIGSAENVIQSIILPSQPGSTVSRSYMDLYPIESQYYSSGTHDHFMSTLSMGPRYILYSGHGETNAIVYNCFTIGDHLTATYGSLPVCVFACCLVNDINLDRSSLGKMMVYTNPGPICVIAPGTSVLYSSNINFLNALSLNLTNPEVKYLGDIYRLAANSFNTSSTQYQRANNYCYNFSGDPALPSYIPTRSVNLERIDGHPFEGDILACAPGTRIRLSGSVTMPGSSDADTDFNGTIEVTVHDGPVTLRSLNHENDPAFAGETFESDETVAGRYATAVSEGRWELTFTVPPTMTKATSNRLNFNAVSTSSVIASSACNPIAIDPSASPTAEAGITDTEAPVTQVWIGSPDFTPGDIVDASPMLYMKLSDGDGSGLSLGYATPGSAPSVRLDGVTRPDLARQFRIGSEGTATALYKLSSLADGRHSLSLSACDLAGNRTTVDVPFTVASAMPATLTASSPIARQEVTYQLAHPIYIPEGKSPTSSRLIIRDLTGETVRTVEHPSYPYTWDLTDDEGHPVPGGTYRASAILAFPPHYSASPEVTVSVMPKLN